MGEQKAVMDEQKAASERLEASQGHLEGEVKASQHAQSQLEASVASQLDLLTGQWNEEIWKVMEQQKTSNKAIEAQLKLLESGVTRPPHSAPPMASQSGGELAFASLAPGDPISAAELQGVQKVLSISNLVQFTDKLVSRLLTDTNVMCTCANSCCVILPQPQNPPSW